MEKLKYTMTETEANFILTMLGRATVVGYDQAKLLLDTVKLLQNPKIQPVKKVAEKPTKPKK